MSSLPDVVNWWCWPLGDARQAQVLSGLLSAEEQQRAARFHSPRDQIGYTIAHGQLRRILADRLAVHPTQIRLGVGDHGKPCLQGDHALRFNLSHTATHALLAVASTEVGADIEDPANIGDSHAVREFICTARERSELTHLPRHMQLTALARLWVRKEAWLKARSVGLLESPRDHHVGIADWHGQWQPLGCDQDNAAWFGADVQAPDGHLASIVLCGSLDALPRLAAQSPQPA